MGPVNRPVPVPLAKDLARAIRDGHPWVFRDAIAGAPRLENGTPVRLVAKDGRPLATAFWDARSTIAARVLEAGPLADPDPQVAARLTATLTRRPYLLD